MRSYLALCRFPAVFTALADIFLGYAVVAGPSLTSRFLIGLLASAGLYLGGMVLNDLLDEAKDREERPERPIPSGRVSKKSAWVFYGALTGTGLIAAASTNLVALAVAAAIVVLVWLYDGPLKRTPLGPLNMGLCRSGNILLGAAVGVGNWAIIGQPKVLWVAGAMGLYVCGLTLFARNEAGKPHRGWLCVGWLIVNAGLAAAVGWAGWHIADGAGPELLLGMFVIVLIVNRRVALALVTPEPSQVQLAVRGMLLAIPVINASLVAMAVGQRGIGWAVATAGLTIPAAFVGRFLKLT